MIPSTWETVKNTGFLRKTVAENYERRSQIAKKPRKIGHSCMLRGLGVKILPPEQPVKPQPTAPVFLLWLVAQVLPDGTTLST